jgi:hypothetical protein
MIKSRISAIRNLTSPRGTVISNQIEIVTDEGVYFQSYDSIILFIDTFGNITLDKTYWDYSKTTLKYIKHFINHPKKEIIKKIKSGEYKLSNLN